MDSSLSLQPFKFFTPLHAINQLTLLELPDRSSTREAQSAPRRPTPDAEVTEAEEWAKYGLPEDDGAGMGKRRMVIVKLGAWMNPYAVGAVRTGVAVLTIFLLMAGLCGRRTHVVPQQALLDSRGQHTQTERH